MVTAIWCLFFMCLINGMGVIIMILSYTRLTAAVAAQTEAVKAAIAAGIGNAAPVDPSADQAQLDLLAAQIEQNNAELVAATPQAAAPVAAATS